MASSVAEAAETLLTEGVSSFFTNGKPSVINRLKKLRNPLPIVVIFILVPLNKIPLFSRELITSTIFFMSLRVSVIPEPQFFTRIIHDIKKFISLFFLYNILLLIRLMVVLHLLILFHLFLQVFILHVLLYQSFFCCMCCCAKKFMC